MAARRPWQRLAALASGLGLTVACTGAGAAPPLASSAQDSLHLHAAEFSLTDDGPWQLVRLPDPWLHRGVAAHQTGRYRLHFQLADLPVHALALRIDRLSRVHALHINGHVLHSSLDAPAHAPRRPVPTLVLLPPALLQLGANRLDIVVAAGAHAGLSPVVIGPQAALDEGFLWSQHRHSTLPQFINAAAAGLSLFLLVLWWRRRSDVALGCFAALSLLVALRNLSYFNTTPLPATGLSDLLFFSLQAATVALLGFFALHHAGGGPAWARRLLWAVLLGYPLLGAAAALAGAMHQARGPAYPGLLAVAAGALGLLLKTTLARRSAMDWLLLGSFALVLGAGAHDYLYQQGHTSVMDSFWLPYATPLALLAFALGLLSRLAQALQASAQMAQLLEHRVAERTAQLQASDRARLRQLMSASHDLRQPLVSIGLLGELLHAQPLPPAARGTLHRLQQAVVHMDALFGRLLEFSRLEAGGVKPALQAVPLQPLFDALAAHAEEPARTRGLRLRLRPTPAVLLADPVLLEQILRNLLANALRYTPRGTVLVAARRSATGHWRIEVRDSGPGIAPADHHRIFDEFLRLPQAGQPGRPASATATDTAGLGLGLAIAQRQAGLMGTRIGLRSAPGCGSCFWLQLPAAPGATAPPAPAPPPAPPGCG